MKETSPIAPSTTAPETGEDQAAKQPNKRRREGNAAEDDESPKRQKTATDAIVEPTLSEPVEVEALKETAMQIGDGTADRDETPPADELVKPKKAARKAKAKAKALPKKEAAPSRRGPSACPECKRRKVCHGSKLCLLSPYLPFHR